MQNPVLEKWSRDYQVGKNYIHVERGKFDTPRENNLEFTNILSLLIYHPNICGKLLRSLLRNFLWSCLGIEFKFHSGLEYSVKPNCQ